MWGGEVAHPTGNSKCRLAQVLELVVWPRLNPTLQTYSGSRQALIQWLQTLLTVTACCFCLQIYEENDNLDK